MTDMPNCRVEVAWTTPPRTRPDDLDFTRIDRAESMLSLPGSAGAYASTPDAGPLDIVGDIDVRADVTLADWSPASIMTLVAKWNALGNRAFRFRLDTTGALRFAWSTDGTAVLERTSTANLAATPAGTRLHVRATLDVITGLVHRVGFYTSPDGVTWTQLGAFVDTALSTSIFASTAGLEVGSSDLGTVGNLTGSVHSAQVRSGIDGTIVAAPSFRAIEPGDTAFTDGAGRLWTVHGAASVIEDPDAGAVSLRSLKTKRGARVKTAEIEAGEATALLGNSGRELDPSNTASPWAPNVKERRRLRYVVEPADGSAERKIHTGFIERLPIGWDVGDGWVEVTSVDLLGLIAGDTLPPSVLHQTLIDSAPVAYWPLVETSGTFADDVVGTRDGEFLRPVVDSVDLIPFDHRTCTMFRPTNSDGATAQKVNAYPYTADTSAVSVSLWFRKSSLPNFVGSTGLVFLQSGRSAASTSASGRPTIDMLIGSAGQFGVFGQESAGVTAWEEATALPLYDGAPHHLAFTLTSAGDLHLYFDGAEVSSSPRDFGGGLFADPLSALDIAAILAAVETFDIGYGVAAVGNTIDTEACVGHVAAYDRALTAAEVAEIHAAGVAPWEQDTIDERIGRVLDLAGIDAGDRDLDVSSVVLGPAVLDGGNLVDYLRKLVATEPGGLMFVNADGQLAFRTAPANDPVPLDTFVGDVDVDAGTPYADVTPDRSLDRVVNVAEVTRENGTTLRTENADSVEEFGPLGVQIDTLHRTASGARGIGARLTNRYRNPRTVLTSVQLNGRRDDVLPASALDLELNDPVDVIARPTGGGDPIEHLALVESVDHDLDWQAHTWQIVYGLAEHVVLPIFAWDTAGQGWDEAVWAAT